MRRDLVPQIAIALLVAVAIGLGLWATGGPNAGRMEKRDRQRLADLRDLVRFVQCRADAAGTLPERLDPDPACNGDIRLNDPFSGLPYAYGRSGEAGFRICAGFEHPESLADTYLDGATFERSTGCAVGTLAGR